MYSSDPISAQELGGSGLLPCFEIPIEGQPFLYDNISKDFLIVKTLDGFKWVSDRFVIITIDKHPKALIQKLFCDTSKSGGRPLQTNRGKFQP